MWVREGGRLSSLVCWHIQVLEHNARREVHAQVQQAWTLIEGLEGLAWVPSREAGLLMGGERTGRAAIPDRALPILMAEAAAARGRRRRLLAWWGWGRPPGQNGWRDEDPPGDAVLLTPIQMEPQTPAPRGAQSPAQGPPQQPDLARDLFELQHRRPGRKRRSPPQNDEGEAELGQGCTG